MDPPLKQWVEETPQLVAIEYHTWFPYPGDAYYQATQSIVIERTGEYSIAQVPSAVMDATTLADENPTVYQAAYDARVGVPSPIFLDATGTYDLVARTGTLVVTITPDGSLGGDHRLRVAITESNIDDLFPNGLNNHQNVLRALVSGTDGEILTFSGPGDAPRVIEAPFAIDAAWNADEIQFVLSVQDASARQVAQAGTVALSELTPVTPVVTTTWSRLKTVF